jgi:3-hydroxybutyryl-CoA dehydrogenase
VEQRDLNGLDTYLSITETLYPDLEDTKEAPPLARAMVARGELGLKTGKGFYDWSGQNPAEVIRRKDQQIVKLLKFLTSDL